VRDHPVSESRLQDGSAAKAILSKPPQLDACFDPHPAANPPSRAQGLLRWQMNPDRNWGPKPRAAKSGKEESVEDRRLKGAKKADESRAKRKADVILLIKLNSRIMFYPQLGYWHILMSLGSIVKAVDSRPV